MSSYWFLWYGTRVGPRGNEPKFDQISQKSDKEVLKTSFEILCPIYDPKSSENSSFGAPFWGVWPRKSVFFGGRVATCVSMTFFIDFGAFLIDLLILSGVGRAFKAGNVFL